MKRLIILSIALALVLFVALQPPDHHLASTTNTPIGSNQSPDRVLWNSTSAGGLFDQTAGATNATPDDVQLGGGISDTQYVGLVSAQFSRIYYNISTRGDTSGGVSWEYWNGALWKHFPGIIDGTKNFTLSGVRSVNFTLPADWTQTTLPISPQGGIQPLTAFYAREKTVRTYNTLPRAGQVWIFASPSVQLELELWNGAGVQAANVSIWVPTLPEVRVANLAKNTTLGTFDFSSNQLGFNGGQAFFVRVSKIGYQNITTAIFTYDTSKASIDLGIFILHGSLRVNVVKAFSPSNGVPSASGGATDRSGLVAPIGTGLNDGTIEFGVDWRVHAEVNVTIFKRGWVTNSTIEGITLTPWNTTTVRVLLETTVRVNVVSQLHNLIPKSTVTVFDSTQMPVVTATDGGVDDADGIANGIVYIAVDPTVPNLNPISIVVSRTGFSTFVAGSWIVSPSTQLNIPTLPGLQYGLTVMAFDELNNPVTLASPNTTFTGLTTLQVDFSQGIAYVAADPAFPGVWTLTQKGYLSTATSTSIQPPFSTGTFKVQTITYQPSGGNGLGLPFSVKVIGVQDELGNSLAIGPTATLASTSGTFIVRSGQAFLPAYGKVNITAMSPGYVSSTLRVDSTSSSQTTIIFGNVTSGATIIRPGLQFSLRVVGVFDELGRGFLLGTKATITSSTSQVFLSAGHAYIPAPISTTLTAAANGYVSASYTIISSTSIQTTVLFKNGGTGATVVEPGLLFTLKVFVIQSWDKSAVQGAIVGVFSDAAMTRVLMDSQSDISGTSYLPLSPATVYLSVSMTNYPTFRSPALQISSSSQMTSTIPFTSKMTIINTGAKANVTLTANTNIFNPGYSATFGVTFSYSSPLAGTVNLTIPKTVIPVGSAVEVLRGDQRIAFQLAQDANNVYLQLPTNPGAANVQVFFQLLTPNQSPSLSPVQSPVVLSLIAVGAVLAVSVPYTLIRRRKVSPEKSQLLSEN